MSFATRTIIFVVGVSLIAAAHVWVDQVDLPARAADVAVGSVNASDADAAEVRLFGAHRTAADDALIVLPILLAIACFARPVGDAVRAARASRAARA
jgi:hypothetical protein